MSDRRLKLSAFQNEKDTCPEAVETSWTTLAEVLRTAVARTPCTMANCATGEHEHPEHRGKCIHKYGEMTSPAYYTDDGRRVDSDVEGVSVYMTDHDDYTEEQFQDLRSRLAGYRHIITSTHGDRSGNRKVRVWMDVDRDVLGAEFEVFWDEATKKIFKGLPVDRSCRNPSRAYFNPAMPSDAPYFYESCDGAALEVNGVLAEALPVPVDARKATPRVDARDPGPNAAEREKQTPDWFRAKLAGVKKDGQRELAECVLRGESWAEPGKREDRCTQLAGMLAKIGPDADPDMIADELAGASLDDMLDAGEWTPRENRDWLAEKIRRFQGTERMLRESDRKILIALVREKKLAVEAARAAGSGVAEAELELASAEEELARRALPTIKIDHEHARMQREALDALNGLGGLYERARLLVGIAADRSVPDWVKYPKGTPIIVPIESEHLRVLMSKSANWVKYHKREEGYVNALVPPHVVDSVYASPEWPFPVLEGISNCPVLRCDGTIQESPGYDEQTRVYYDPQGVVFPAIPLAPTQVDAARAYEELMEPFCDFPFVDQSDRAATAALILSMIARPAIRGEVPVFGVEAPARGAGKGRIIDGASIIATGLAAPKMASCGENEEEWRKRIFAIGLQGPRLVCLDNVKHGLTSATLEMAITSGSISDRVLGQSKNATVSLRTIWTYTGVNVELSPDLGRRTIPIHLDPRCLKNATPQEMEHPEDRSNFRHPDLLRYMSDNRPRLVVAALTILKAFFVAGCPKHSKPAKGSFEDWDGIVRGAVIWAGGADPHLGVERSRGDANEEADQLHTMLETWEHVYGQNEKTLNEVVGDCFSLGMLGQSGEKESALRALKRALEIYGTRAGKFDLPTLGKGLRSIKNRVIGGRSLTTGKKKTQGTTWKLEIVNRPLP